MRSDERGALSLPGLVGGVVAAVALAAVVAVVLPVTDSALGSGAAGKPRVYSQSVLDGRKLYIREGCFSCHSMQVRDASSDSVLGSRVSGPADYFNEAPALMGDDRIGPDLTCVGDRESDATWHVRHLRRPASVRHGSSMPSYRYLSSRELQALAQYLLALTCK